MTSIFNLFVEKSIESLLKGSYTVNKKKNNKIIIKGDHIFKYGLLKDSNLLNTIHEESIEDLKNQFKEEILLLDLIQKILNKEKNFNYFIKGDYINSLKSYNFIIYQKFLFKFGFCSLTSNQDFFVYFSFLVNKQIRNLSFLNRNSNYNNFNILNDYPIYIIFLLVQELSVQKSFPIIDLLLIDPSINEILKRRIKNDKYSKHIDWVFYVNILFKAYNLTFKTKTHKKSISSVNEYYDYRVYKNIINYLGNPDQKSIFNYIGSDFDDDVSNKRYLISNIYHIDNLNNNTNLKVKNKDKFFNNILVADEFDSNTFYNLIKIVLSELSNIDYDLLKINSFDELLQTENLILMFLTRVEWPELIKENILFEAIDQLIQYVDYDGLIYHNLILMILIIKSNQKNYFTRPFNKLRFKLKLLPDLLYYNRNFNWQDHFIHTIEKCLKLKDIENFLNLIYLSDIDLFKDRSIKEEEIILYKSIFNYDSYNNNSKIKIAIKLYQEKLSELFINHYRYYNHDWKDRQDELYLDMIRSLVNITGDYTLLETINSIKTFKEY